jgi:CRP-like cAMP-binding protein
MLCWFSSNFDVDSSAKIEEKVSPPKELCVINSRLPLDAWPDDLQLTEPASYPAGIELFSVGQPIRALHLIEEGVVKVTASACQGRVALIGFRGHGWLLGLSTVISSRCYDTAALTIAPSIVRQISPIALEKAWHQSRAVTEWLLRMLARESIANAERISGLVGGGSERIEMFLAELARMGTSKLSDGSLRLHVPLTVEEIGQAVCLGREHVSRLISSLEKEGVIRRDKGWILIPTESRLRS